MGMLFFLFPIGLDLEIGQIRRLGRYIIGGDIALTLTEGFLLALFLYFVFPQFVSYSFVVALLAGVAFGTVGEVVLLAILKEFGLEKTRFGQLALGIGVFDDIFEILALALIVALPALTATGARDVAAPSPLLIVLSLSGILLATVLLARLSKLTRHYLDKVPTESFVVPFAILMVIFSFIYFGTRELASMGVVAAIFAGIAVKQVFPESAIQQYKKPIFFVANIFLGPFFFLSLGGRMSMGALVTYPLLILAIITIALFTRLSLSYLLFHRLLGKRQSLIMGVGLTSKFSTSVVSENLLFASA
jgi:CPA2 family monovalent cation:H+ antiporter-2